MNYKELKTTLDDIKLKYETLMNEYYELSTLCIEKEIEMLQKRYNECETELSILEHEFIFS